MEAKYRRMGKTLSVLVYGFWIVGHDLTATADANPLDGDGKAPPLVNSPANAVDF